LWSERRFLGVEMPLLLQFSIALFTGMVAATLVPPVRRVVPRPIEIALWAVLVVVCVIGVTSITNPQARELTASAFWGVDQVIVTLAGLLAAGLTGWLFDTRFVLATWLTIACGVDILALALLRSYKKGRAWQPRVRLYEWMELPRLTSPAAAPVAVPYAVDDLSRRLEAAMAVAGAALLASLVQFMIWSRDVMLPQQAARLARAAEAGRGGSLAGLESLRDTASQLQFAARAWYVAAGAPAVNGLAGRATETVRTIGRGRSDDGAPDVTTGRLVDIHVLMSAQSIGWYGPMRPASTVQAEEGEDESQQTGRLAS
jgi:type IV secretory pathway TrbD component